jgi:hypothetical protein
MASRTANKTPLREAPRIPAGVAVIIITAGSWVYFSKGCRRARMSIIPKETSISQFAVHSYCPLKQERLFRIPADTIGRHHNKKKLNSKYATREAFPA